MAQPRATRISCRADADLSLAIRDDGRVVLARADPEDPSQQWLRDYAAAGRLTDEVGRSAFVLANKGRRQALANRQPPGQAGQAASLVVVPYAAGMPVDLSMLWAEGADPGDGFREVRWVKDTSRTIGVVGEEGALVGVVGESSPGDKQKDPRTVWKFTPVSG